MEKIYDIVVVGGGPAGLTAALYGLRNGKDVLVIEKSVFGGQIVNSPNVENIPGFVSISGDEYGDLLLKQVQTQGGNVMFDEVLNIENDGQVAKLKLDLSDDVYGKTVILATGTIHRTLGLENEDNLIGNKIHFCAVCDGNFYQGKKVVMIGGGNSAFVESILLADIVDKLVILQDMPYFTADQKLQEKLLTKNNVETHLNTKVLAYEMNDNELRGVRYLENGEEKLVECDGIFLAVGLIPNNDAFKDLVETNAYGYFEADETGITKQRNIFVAGDCRSKTLRQVATAIADGANAAIKACDLLNK
ncbi:MAG: FAD-dependent oxidoreductase [Erysipelotrichaceae bacterium]|nr:FAD-dependent oxidoreductase [Erysipelotrichaceae bacterium]